MEDVIKMMTHKERRQKYLAMEKKGFTDEELIRVMPYEELKMNARRGGELAIRELRRREIEFLKTSDLDLGV